MAEEEAFVLRGLAESAQRELYPEDMGFLPLSTKFCEGAVLKTPWLAKYFSYRNVNRENKLSRQDYLDYLAQAGADHSDQADRSRGALLGLALGDTLGVPLEFSPRDRKQVSDIEGGGPFDLKPGEWTDDTSMACCLAYSLISCGGFDPTDQMLCYVYWYRYGAFSSNGTCFDIGGATRTALESFIQTREPYSGSTDPRMAGNGSLMRLAPIPVFYFDSFDQSVRFSGLSSRTTHQATEAVDACRYFGALLHGALHGVSKERLLDGIYEPIEGYWNAYPLAPAVEAVARGSYKHKRRDEISSSGYVIHTLEAALWAVYHHDNFRDAVLAAVNLADDSDTVGAVCGQIAGAYWGETQLPIEWILHTNNAHGFYHFAQDLRAAHQEKRFTE
jgi:ADP-ribosylglycohydrolase